jgi:hypothetical protein
MSLMLWWLLGRLTHKDYWILAAIPESSAHSKQSKKIATNKVAIKERSDRAREVTQGSLK